MAGRQLTADNEAGTTCPAMPGSSVTSAGVDSAKGGGLTRAPRPCLTLDWPVTSGGATGVDVSMR